MSEILRRNATPRGRDAHEDVEAALLGRDADAPALRRVSHSVLQEIRKHLVEMIGVGAAAKGRREIQVDVQGTALERRGVQLDRRRDRLA